MWFLSYTNEGKLSLQGSRNQVMAIKPRYNIALYSNGIFFILVTLLLLHITELRNVGSVLYRL